MNIPCDLILDLLPMYQNNLCSEGSNVIIEAHLSTCEKCNNILNKMDEITEIPQCEVDAVMEKVLRAVYKRQN